MTLQKRVKVVGKQISDIKMNSIQCPNCKANIEMENGIDLARCSYCGAQIEITGQNHKIIGARLISKTIDKHYDAKQKKLEAKRLAEIEKQIKAEKDRKIFLIASPIFILFFVLSFIFVKFSSDKEERELQELSTQVQADIDDGDYEKALAEANQIKYTGNWSSEIEEKWDNTRETYIDIINKHINSNSDSSDTISEDTSIEKDVDETSLDNNDSNFFNEGNQIDESEAMPIDNIKMEHGSEYFIGSEWDRDSLTRYFTNLGFTNVKAETFNPDENTIMMNIKEIYITTPDKKYYMDAWNEEDSFSPDSIIVFYYNGEPPLTVDNCKELSNYVYEGCYNCVDFAEKYDGRFVILDAVITTHTTYDGGLSHVIYGKQEGSNGPEINLYDDGFNNDYDDSVEVGDRVYVMGKISERWTEYYKHLYLNTEILMKKE